MDSDDNIGTLPTSEWQFSVRHIFFLYRNDRCRCWISDIANIKIDVDAHPWSTLCKILGLKFRIIAVTFSLKYNDDISLLI